MANLSGRFFFQLKLRIFNDHILKLKIAKNVILNFHSFQTIAQLFGEKQRFIFSEGKGRGEGGGVMMGVGLHVVD